MISRFDVWLTRLEPTLGHEIQKTRPCIVVSPDELNRTNWTVIVVPLTSQLKVLPTRIRVDFGGKKGQVVLDQIRAVDPKRLTKQLGRIDYHSGIQILTQLQNLFSFNHSS